MPVYKDKKRGTWYASFYYTDWTGIRKKKKKSGFIRQSDAKAYERDFLSTTGSAPIASDITFSMLVNEYLKDCSIRLKQSTLQTKENMIRTKLLPYLADMKITDITPLTVRTWQNKMLNSNYTPTYLKTINNQLSAILNFAVKFYGLSNNPCHITGSIGRNSAEAMQIWTKDEYAKFIHEVKAPAAHLAFELLFWTGIREGELLALRPDDFLPSKKLSITKTFSKIKGENIITEPKTPKSKRQIDIPDFLYDEVQEYISKLYDIKDEDRLFYFSKGYLTYHLSRAAEKAGVKRIRIHDLRHSHASLLIDMGFNIFAISERLGHEKVDTTMNTYGHLYPDRRDEMMISLSMLKNELNQGRV